MQSSKKESTEETLRLLIVNCSSNKFEHIKRVIDEGVLHADCSYARNNNEAFHVLTKKRWDLVLSGHDLTQPNAIDLLQWIANRNLDLPLIIVSAYPEENAANELMALGATDYITSAKLTRLIPAIKRSMTEMVRRQEFKQVQSDLQKIEDRFQTITSNLPGVVFQFLLTNNHKINFPYVSDASETLLGISPQHLIANSALFFDLILPDDKENYDQLMALSASKLSTLNWEGRIQVKGDNDYKWISLRATPRKIVGDGTVWDGIMINITRNKQSENEITQSREHLAELSSYLQKIKEHERARIAREIHDDIGGTLTAIKCELLPCIDKTARLPDFYQKKAASIENLVDHVIDSTRRISLDLRPGILDCGIVAAIQWQAKEFGVRTKIPCHVICSKDEILLDADLSIAIFRIFQETLTNISKHANASCIKVKLSEAKEIVSLDIVDNGDGITDSDLNKPNSFGIRGMRERCQQLKGTFQIANNPSGGTKVEIRIPIEEKTNLPQTMFSQRKCEKAQLSYINIRKATS